MEFWEEPVVKVQVTEEMMDKDLEAREVNSRALHNFVA